MKNIGRMVLIAVLSLQLSNIFAHSGTSIFPFFQNIQNFKAKILKIALRNHFVKSKLSKNESTISDNSNVSYNPVLDSLFLSYFAKDPSKCFEGNQIVLLRSHAVIQASLALRESVVETNNEMISEYIPLGAGDINIHSLSTSDSLLNIWLSQGHNFMYNDASDNSAQFNDSLRFQITDEQYTNRLNKISSVIDLTYNEHSKEFIYKYTSRGMRYVVGQMLGLSEYYFPMFEEILDAYKIPLELKYLPIIESAMNPRAVSRAGATGIWQFIKGTGKYMGLENSPLVDERMDPIKSTHAAARYLKSLYNIYNDWTLALAAYNCGAGNVNRAIKRSGGKINYWQIYEYLPRETRKYVPAFIGAIYAMNYYKEYNIKPYSGDLPNHCDSVVVSGSNLHLDQIASILNISLTQIQDLNPHFKKSIVPAKDKNYAVLIPSTKVSKYIQHYDSIVACKTIKVQDLAKECSKAKVTQVTSPSKAKLSYNGNYMYYTVRPGDTFWHIAQRFDGVTCNELLMLNNMNSSSRINPGDVIKIKRI